MLKEKAVQTTKSRVIIIFIPDEKVLIFDDMPLMCKKEKKSLLNCFYFYFPLIIFIDRMRKKPPVVLSTHCVKILTCIMIQFFF